MKVYRVLVVADLELPDDVDISEEGLQDRREAVIQTWLVSVKEGFGVMFNVPSDQVDPSDFNVYIGEVKEEVEDELSEPEAEDRIEDSPQPALV